MLSVKAAFYCNYLQLVLSSNHTGKLNRNPFNQNSNCLMTRIPTENEK